MKWRDIQKDCPVVDVTFMAPVKLPQFSRAQKTLAPSAFRDRGFATKGKQ
jgi:hypothetical protein